MIEYRFYIHKNDKLRFSETPRIEVFPPYDVLGDLSNVPSSALPKIIRNLREDVLTGKKPYELFGWHRVSCTAEAENTYVEDLHAEYVEDALPNFEVPTSEILKMLEDWYEFYQEWDNNRP